MWEGISVSHPEQLIAAGYDLKEIGTKLVDNYATQVLDDGFFHADPHPGNIIIAGGQIVLIDLGMTGRLNAKTRSVLKQMIFAVAKQDSPALADGLLRFAGTESDASDYPALLADLDTIVAEYGTVDLKDPGPGLVRDRADPAGAARHGIEVPSTVTTVARALVTLEGLLDEFIPDVNMIEIISEHIATSKPLDRAAADEVKSLGVEAHAALHGLLGAALRDQGGGAHAHARPAAGEYGAGRRRGADAHALRDGQSPDDGADRGRSVCGLVDRVFRRCAADRVRHPRSRVHGLRGGVRAVRVDRPSTSTSRAAVPGNGSGPDSGKCHGYQDVCGIF